MFLLLLNVVEVFDKYTDEPIPGPAGVSEGFRISVGEDVDVALSKLKLKLCVVVAAVVAAAVVAVVEVDRRKVDDEKAFGVEPGVEVFIAVNKETISTKTILQFVCLHASNVG